MKKTYISPAMNVHGLKLESMILVGVSKVTPTQALNAGGIRMGTQTALSKGGGGPLIDDDDDFDDDGFDY